MTCTEYRHCDVTSRLARHPDGGDVKLYHCRNCGAVWHVEPPPCPTLAHLAVTPQPEHRDGRDSDLSVAGNAGLIPGAPGRGGNPGPAIHEGRDVR